MALYNRIIVPLNHLANAPAHGALYGGVMHVSSVGRVSLPDRSGPPRIELRQLTTTQDVAVLTDVASEMLDLLETEPLQAAVRNAYLDADGTPAATIRGDRDRIREWATTHLSGFHHLTSTCREGVVTDPFGRLLGYENLFICDASLFAKSPPRSPFMPIVQMAERLSAAWRADEA